MAFLARILGLDKLLIYLVVALAAGGAVWGWGASKYAAGRNAGIAEERVVWEEARRKLLVKMETDRRSAQATIDKAEQNYLDATLRGAAQIAALEEALLAEKDDDEANPAGSDATRPFISHRVFRQLDATGR